MKCFSYQLVTICEKFVYTKTAPDGSVRACATVHVDPCTGLIHPISNAHMLLASGHSMPVPSDFFLHPYTGRVLPVAGNVGFDPSSSTLVYTTDAFVGKSKIAHAETWFSLVQLSNHNISTAEFSTKYEFNI